ncbi:MAG: TIGR02300 family protein [Alphaproteobacteria bacterium]
MVKPEWGTKRICQSCGAKFYDFGRSPIVCPACGATFELESPSPRGRRQRAAPERAAAAAAAAPAAVEEEEELETVVEDEVDEAGYEDTDDLAEDGDVDVVPPEEDENS